MPGKQPERDLVELVMFCSLIRVLVIQVCSVCEHLFSGILAVYALPICIFLFFLINFFFNLLFILVLAALGLRWVFIAARGLFSGRGEQGPLFVAARRLLVAVASLVAEHGL